VNGIRAVERNGFLDWLDKEKPDILCVQESRAHPEQIPPELRQPKGYATFWQPAKKPGYAGTALYTRIEPVSVGALGIEAFDSEGRVQVVEFDGFTLVNAYFPNSQPERARIDYKLAFCGAIQAFCDDLRKQGRHVVLCGDYNIAHTEIDLARPKENEENPGYLPEEREAMTALLESGLVDTFRHFHPEPGNYTWWSYRGGARQRNVGWRLDYHCVDAALMPRIQAARIHADVKGSDHCPVSVTIA
jgi:exodeoxyribonuclease-3